MSDKNGPTTYQERREAKKYIEQRLRELALSHWTLEKGLQVPLPSRIRNAKRAVNAYEQGIKRKASRMCKRFEQKIAPIREDLIMGRFLEALVKIKGLEKLRASLVRKGRFED